MATSYTSKKQRVEIKSMDSLLNEIPSVSTMSTDDAQKSGKRLAKTLEEFFDNPTNLILRKEQLDSYVEEETLLTNAVKMQKSAVVLSLLTQGADPNIPNKKGVTPISAAAHKGNIVIMKQLIDYKASVNALNTSGSTALIQASHFGHVEAVRLLLQHQATADFYNLKGTTALMRASQEGHVEISKLLIAAGAEVNRKNYEGMNALMLASQRGHAAMVMLLVKAPCNMDEQTQQGSTALMLACKRGHEECVKVLVTLGAEIFIRDNRGRNARETAQRRNHHGLLQWLETPTQIRLHQEFLREERKQTLLQIRQAFEAAKLRLDTEERNCLNLLLAYRRRVANPQGGLAPTALSHSFVPDWVASNFLHTTPIDILSTFLSPAHPVIPASCGAADMGSVEHSLTASPMPTSASGLSPRVSTLHLSSDHDTKSSEKNTFYTGAYEQAYDALIQRQVDRIVVEGIPYPLAHTTHPTHPHLHRDPMRGTRDREGDSTQALKGPGAGESIWETPSVEDSRNHPFISSIIKSPKHPGMTQTWEWSLLLLRSLSLPTGIYDLICEFLPLPADWGWTLEVLKRRCPLLPQQCVHDLCKLMDEILADANIFRGSNQKRLLCRLNECSQVYPHLVLEWGMSPGLINTTRVWADVQSLVHRATVESDVSFKAPIIRNLLTATCELYRWTHSRASPYRMLVEATGSAVIANELLNTLSPHRRGRKTTHEDMLARDLEDDVSLQGLDTVMDQDTETELHNDADADDTQDEDSDAEMVAGPAGIGQVHGQQVNNAH